MARRPGGFVPPRPCAGGGDGLGVLAVVRAAVRDRAELRWLVRRGGAPDAGPLLSVGRGGGQVLVVLATKRPLGANYLLPLYASCRSGLGECFWWLAARWRWLGGGALGGWLAFHLWAHWAARSGREPADTALGALHAIVRPLTDWLVARGLRVRVLGAGARYPPTSSAISPGMRVMAADIWAETVIQHAHAVDAGTARPS